jgi:hypothetical protein
MPGKRTKVESPTDVERWFRAQAADLWPAALGSLSFRRSPCVRARCDACARGDQHPSHVLYCRINGRRVGIYVPHELVPQIQQSLDNGRALQALLYQAGRRYTNAVKQQRAAKK